MILMPSWPKKKTEIKKLNLYKLYLCLKDTSRLIISKNEISKELDVQKILGITFVNVSNDISIIFPAVIANRFWDLIIINIIILLWRDGISYHKDSYIALAINLP